MSNKNRIEKTTEELNTLDRKGIEKYFNIDLLETSYDETSYGAHYEGTFKDVLGHVWVISFYAKIFPGDVFSDKVVMWSKTDSGGIDDIIVEDYDNSESLMSMLGEYADDITMQLS